MAKIQTKSFIYGDPKEATWPPQFGTGHGFRGYWDRDKQEFVEGTPPVKFKPFGKAPTVIPDSISPYYHPRAQRVISSRADLRDTDKALGTITTDKHIPPDPTWANEQKRKRDADRTEAMHKAVAQIDAGTAPMTEETRAKCEQTNEIVSSAMGFDAFNVAGRKKNGKGKRFRRR